MSSAEGWYRWRGLVYARKGGVARGRLHGVTKAKMDA